MEKYTGFSGHASLATVGMWMSDKQIRKAVEEHVKIKQKVIKHTPTDKMKDLLIHILAGGHGIVDVSLDMKDDNHYRLNIRDHGIGISRENQKRAFEPFFTTGRSIGGTGLGLSIVHNLVTNALKGEIKLKSEQGKGTVFEIIFPRVIPG